MDELFGELLRLPCWYCNYYYSCSNKQKRTKDDIRYSKCLDMELNFELVIKGCKAYFDYVKQTQIDDKSS